MEKLTSTQVFLGDETYWPAVSIELIDVQGLWGGRRIRVTDGGQMVVQIVQPGMIEQRYELRLSPSDFQQLLRVLIENDFLTLHPADRPGIPDEARPAITVINAAGEKWMVAKWAGVKDERFSAIYAEFLRLEALTKSLQPVYRGPFQASN
jgi:hypothetical protein